MPKGFDEMIDFYSFGEIRDFSLKVLIFHSIGRVDHCLLIGRVDSFLLIGSINRCHLIGRNILTSRCSS